MKLDLSVLLSDDGTTPMEETPSRDDSSEDTPINSNGSKRFNRETEEIYILFKFSRNVGSKRDGVKSAVLEIIQQHIQIVTTFLRVFDPTDVMLFDKQNSFIPATSAQGIATWEPKDHSEHFDIHSHGQGQNLEFRIVQLIRSARPLHHIRNHPEISSCLRETKCYLRRHHWSCDVVDTSVPGWFLLTHPQLQLAADFENVVREKLSDELKRNPKTFPKLKDIPPFKIIQVSPTTRQMSKTNSSKAFGVETPREHNHQLDKLLRHAFKDTYVKSRLRYSDEPAYLAGISAQNCFLRNAKCIPILGVSHETMARIRPLILESGYFVNISETNKTPSIGRWNAVAKNHSLFLLGTKWLLKNIRSLVDSASTSNSNFQPQIGKNGSAQDSNSWSSDSSYSNSCANSFRSIESSISLGTSLDSHENSVLRDTVSDNGSTEGTPDSSVKRSYADVARPLRRLNIRESPNTSELTSSNPTTYSVEKDNRIHSLEMTVKEMSSTIEELRRFIMERLPVAVGDVRRNDETPDKGPHQSEDPSPVEDVIMENMEGQDLIGTSANKRDVEEDGFTVYHRKRADTKSTPTKTPRAENPITETQLASLSQRSGLVQQTITKSIGNMLTIEREAQAQTAGRGNSRTTTNSNKNTHPGRGAMGRGRPRPQPPPPASSVKAAPTLMELTLTNSSTSETANTNNVATSEIATYAMKSSLDFGQARPGHE